MRTVVHLLRHGEVFNPTGVLYGRLPGFNLSERGREQAQTVADFLTGADLTYLVASPLDRAQQTAAPVAASHGLDINTDSDLIECDNMFEGLTVSMDNGAWKNPKHWWKLRNPFRPSWAEPYVDIAVRMRLAIERARIAAEGHEALCVSHQSPIWITRLSLEGKRLWHDPRKRQCSLASLTSLVYDGDTLVDIHYAEPAGASDPSVTGA